jgi:hypothetical protein
VLSISGYQIEKCVSTVQEASLSTVFGIISGAST